jgi:CheY-like chemotaxis protein
MSSRFLYGESVSPIVTNNTRRLILSVDDEPLILYSRQKILECAGYDVLSAADGDQALHVFSGYSGCIDLVLLDYMMPGRNGGDVAREMKGIRAQTPIILVSASEVPERILACFDCRIDKGEGPATLLAKISQMLAGPAQPTRRARASIAQPQSRNHKHRERRL